MFEMEENMRYSFPKLGKYYENRCGILVGKMRECHENTDIEVIHDIRTSIRRILALENFFGYIFDKKKMKKYVAELKKIFSDAGEMRDIDIQIKYLAEYLEKYPGVKNYTEKISRKKDKLMTKFKETADNKKISDIETKLKKASSDYQEKGGTKDKLDKKAVKFTEKIENEFRKTLFGIVKGKELHMLRKKIKTVKYSLEIIKKYAIVPEDIMKEAEKLQAVLGEIQDKAVLIKNLREYFKTAENAEVNQLIELIEENRKMQINGLVQEIGEKIYSF